MGFFVDIKCDLCSENISSDFNYCPKCGYCLADSKVNSLTEKMALDLKSYALMPDRISGLEDRMSNLKSKVTNFIGKAE